MSSMGQIIDGIRKSIFLAAVLMPASSFAGAPFDSIIAGDRAFTIRACEQVLADGSSVQDRSIFHNWHDHETLDYGTPNETVYGIDAEITGERGFEFVATYDPNAKIKKAVIQIGERVDGKLVVQDLPLEFPVLKRGDPADVYIIGHDDSLPNRDPGADYVYDPSGLVLVAPPAVPVARFNFEVRDPLARLRRVLSSDVLASVIGVGSSAEVFVSHPHFPKDLFNNLPEAKAAERKRRWVLENHHDLFKVRLAAANAWSVFRRDWWSQFVGEQLLSKATYKGRQLIRVARMTLDHIDMAITGMEVITGPTTYEIREMLDVYFDVGNCDAQCQHKIKTIFASYRMPPPVAWPKILGAVEQAFRDTHTVALMLARANKIRPIGNWGRNRKAYEVILDLNRGRNLAWDPVTQMLVEFD